MEQNSNNLFANNEVFFRLTNAILENTNMQSLKFLDNEEFNNILSKDIKMSNEVYFKEIMYRVYFVCISGLYRNLKWKEGIVNAYELSNIFLLCSSIRGFIESCTDIFYSISDAPKVIVKNFAIFHDALSKNLDIVISFRELEDNLIHYIYGRKLSKNEVKIDSHIAKTTQEYIQNFQKFDSEISTNVEDLYKYLCQIVHPSSASILFLNDFSESLNINFDNEKIIIKDITLKFSQLTDPLLQYSMNPILILLKLLNYLPINEISLDIMKTIELSNLKLWREFEEIRSVLFKKN